MGSIYAVMAIIISGCATTQLDNSANSFARNDNNPCLNGTALNVATATPTWFIMELRKEYEISCR